MDNPDHILIVDDDPEIRRLLVDYLAKNGFEPVAARDGREMAQMLDKHAIDLLVLMLTARGEEADRIVGIEMGGA